MKAIHLILFLSVIIFNEIVMEIVVYGDHSISLIDGSVEEKVESKKTEVEGEKEVDFFNDWVTSPDHLDKYYGSSSALDVTNALNPYIEIHSPPPEFF